MNRKLQNTFTALTASLALLVLGLVASLPAGSALPQPSAPAASMASAAPAGSGLTAATALSTAPAAGAAGEIVSSRLAADIAAAAALAAALSSASADADTQAEILTSPRGTTRRHRQTVVMPYFSFAPRG